MLSFKVFQPIIESRTSRLTFTMSHTSTSPICSENLYSLNFIFNGTNVVLFDKIELQK